MLEQRLLNQLRNMMFKSFTHEIKTPLNGVIQSMELTFSVLQSLKTRHTARPSTLPVNEYGQLHQLMK
jgi:K+-sensing histidine kinase KdpD